MTNGHETHFIIIAILSVSIIFIIFVPLFLAEETGETICIEEVCFPELRHVSFWDLFLEHLESNEPCRNELGFLICLHFETLPQIFGFIAIVIIIVVVFKFKKIRKLF